MKSAYLTTAAAGYFVAGQKIPSIQDADGNRTPKVGHQLMLTPEEAKYELLAGVIIPAPAEGETAPAAALTAPAAKRSSKALEAPANEG
jgi:hypothetical protein